MINHTKQYINGEWVDSTDSKTIDVINPATEEVIGKVSSGTEEDVNRAVQAAKAAFTSYSKSSREERIKLLEDIVKEYENRKDDLVNIMTKELGSPITNSEKIHYQMGLGHFKQAAEELKKFQFTEERENSYIQKEPVGSNIMKNAAEDIKNISLELGGKSPLVVLKDADVKEAAKSALSQITKNTGQVCSAATRMIIPEKMQDEFIQAMKELLPNFPVGDPLDKNTVMGPQVSEEQWEKVQYYIKKGQEEGATLAIGGPGKPEGIDKGFYSKITVFSNVKNDMTIAQEEIFGPVMSIITYKDIDEAIEIANDTIYGLAGYVFGNDKEELKKVALNIRAGQIRINDGKPDMSAPFGGFKQSGIGREWGDYGIEEFLEPKAIMGMPS